MYLYHLHNDDDNAYGHVYEDINEVTYFIKKMEHKSIAKVWKKCDFLLAHWLHVSTGVIFYSCFIISCSRRLL